MTILEAVAQLMEEKLNALPSRFPCRVIMVKNIKEYCTLLSELKKISDIRVIQTAKIVPGADVLPKYDLLQASIYQNEWLILTGVSEYLRLFARKEASEPRFARIWRYQSPASSTGRIIIPLWGCEAQWFDPSLHLCDDLRQSDFYICCSESDEAEQKMEILALSIMFEKHVAQLENISGQLIYGMRDWFEYWSSPLSNNTHFVLLTKFCKQLVPMAGNISIRVMKDTISFLQEKMDGASILNEANCTEEMANELFAHALKGVCLDTAILQILNVSEFVSADVMGKWKSLSSDMRLFIPLWLTLHPENTYLSHCYGMCEDTTKIDQNLLHEIFNVRLVHPEWVLEYQKLAKAMPLIPDEQFFDKLNSIPEYELRLDYLTSGTREERIYLLRMVGKWMREDPSQALASQKLQQVYPQLYAYLQRDTEVYDNIIARYLSLYKAYKLENTLPTDEDAYFADFDTGTYDYRHSVLSDSSTLETVILWVDALGVEWMSLLLWSINKYCDVTVARTAIAQASLPTETRFNDQWNNMPIPSDKLDKLDSLAHKGIADEPDYYACIEEQMNFVDSICKRINTLLAQYHRVIITGDHGTSRLAARFFHVREGIAAPQKAKVLSHGRCCELSTDAPILTSTMRSVKHSDGSQYIVFTNYDHFKQSGFAAGVDDDNAIYGEVHGGASPEEMLVPVIVVDSNRKIPLIASWDNSSVKILQKKAKITLNFNRPVQQLAVKVAGIDGAVRSIEDGSSWAVILTGIKAGKHEALVVADQQIMTLPELKINAALGDGDGDLG